MGFFDKFRKKETVHEGASAPVRKSYEQLLTEIAACISKEDESVMRELKRCTSDTAGYFRANADQYEARGMDELEDIQWTQWIGLVDILEKHNYVCERDWKDELDDFLYFLQELNGMKANPLPIEREWLDDQGDIVEWCRSLDDTWASQDMCVAAMDIESDSYVLFPCKTAVLERLQQWAGQMGRRIDSAKNM